jgi:DNA-binding transcriptional regulator GbsR (MarR family)
MSPDREPDPPPLELPRADVVRRFVEHWGGMARLWGINSTMGELFALLYLTGVEWSADDLRAQLRISRGNVSMNLRELISWGVVYKMHRQGERREYYRAETDVWTLFRRIIVERKRREITPTLQLLGQTVTAVRGDHELAPLLERAGDLHRFFRTVDLLADRLLALEPDELEGLLKLLDPGPTPSAEGD